MQLTICPRGQLTFKKTKAGLTRKEKERKKEQAYLQEPDGDDNSKLHAGAPLQRARPWPLTRQSPIEPRHARHRGRREWPGHVIDAPEPAALKGVLDCPDGLDILGAEEPLPQGGQLAAAGVARHDVGGVQGGKDRGEDALEGLEDSWVRGVEQGLGLVRGVAGEVGEREGVCCGDDGEQDRQEGQDWGQWEGKGDAADVFVSDRSSACTFSALGCPICNWDTHMATPVSARMSCSVT